MTLADLRIPCVHGRYVGHPMLNGVDVSRRRALPNGVELCPGGRPATIEDLIGALVEGGILRDKGVNYYHGRYVSEWEKGWTPEEQAARERAARTDAALAKALDYVRPNLFPDMSETTLHHLDLIHAAACSYGRILKDDLAEIQTQALIDELVKRREWPFGITPRPIDRPISSGVTAEEK